MQIRGKRGHQISAAAVARKQRQPGARQIRMPVYEPAKCGVDPLVGGYLENRNAPHFT
jgi:hypothetical protein